MISFANVYAAASVSMSVSGTAEVGKTISVSLTISGTDGPYSGFSGGFVYNSNLLTLQSFSSSYKSNWYEDIGVGTFSNGNATIPTDSRIITATFLCKAAGDTTISLDSFEVDGIYSSASRSISIKTPVPQSNNANLASLLVSPGTLSPSFSASKTSYAMDVAEDVTKVSVTAVAADSKAKVSLNGVQNNIKPGTNTIKITVKAEDGTTKVYSIKVTRASGPTGTPTPSPEPLPLMEYLGSELMIVAIDENTSIPEGFTASTSTYKGVEIPVFKGPAQAGSTDEILLVQLLTEQEIRYFVYDPTLQIVYPLLFVKQPETSLRILDAGDAAEVPFGYEAFPFEYEGEEVTAYRLISDPLNPQILLYLMDAGGQAVFYYYDTEKLMVMPYRGETVLVEPSPTPSPSPDPAESVPSETGAEPAVTTEPSVVPTESKSVFDSITDFKNPFTIMFYLVGLIALVLAAAVVALMLNRRSAYDDDYDDDYLPEDEAIPPLAVYSQGNRHGGSIDPDDVFEEHDGSKPIKSEMPYIPSIARVDEPVRPTPNRAVSNPSASTGVATPTRPVADATPIMGVRAIHMDSIPELFEQRKPIDQPIEKPNEAPNIHSDPVRSNPVVTEKAKTVQNNQADPAKADGHIPVRLKQELDAEKAKAVNASPSVASTGAVAPSDSKKSNTLDFPDLKRSTATAEDVTPLRPVPSEAPSMTTEPKPEMKPEPRPAAEPDPDFV